MYGHITKQQLIQIVRDGDFDWSTIQYCVIGKLLAHCGIEHYNLTISEVIETAASLLNVSKEVVEDIFYPSKVKLIGERLFSPFHYDPNMVDGDGNAVGEEQQWIIHDRQFQDKDICVNYLERVLPDSLVEPKVLMEAVEEAEMFDMRFWTNCIAAVAIKASGGKIYSDGGAILPNGLAFEFIQDAANYVLGVEDGSQLYIRTQWHINYDPETPEDKSSAIEAIRDFYYMKDKE